MFADFEHAQENLTFEMLSNYPIGVQLPKELWPKGNELFPAYERVAPLNVKTDEKKEKLPFKFFLRDRKVVLHVDANCRVELNSSEQMADLFGLEKRDYRAPTYEPLEVIGTKRVHWSKQYVHYLHLL